MRCRPFRADVATANVAATLDEARRVIADGGGSLVGDTDSGRFSIRSALGLIRGKYSVGEDTVELTITGKPLGIGCAVIESRIREYFK